MSLIWEGQVITDDDIKFLKSIHVSEKDMHELDEKTLQQLNDLGIGFSPNWKNANDRWHEEHLWKFTPVITKPCDGKPGMKPSTLMASLIVGALIWSPILIHFWRTK